MIVVGDGTFTHWLTTQALPHAPLLVRSDVYATFKAFVAPHDQELMAHS
jgi:hypothetical protein